jgi:hypothetical protein
LEQKAEEKLTKNKHFGAKKLRKVRLRMNLTAQNTSANLRPKAMTFVRQPAYNSTPIDLLLKLLAAILNLRKPMKNLEWGKQHATCMPCATISHPITKPMERRMMNTTVVAVKITRKDSSVSRFTSRHSL